jgi:hypothetical protein
MNPEGFAFALSIVVIALALAVWGCVGLYRERRGKQKDGKLP